MYLQESQKKALEMWANILNNGMLQQTISITSLFVLFFESFKDMVINRPHGFFGTTHNLANGKVTCKETEGYKAKIRSLDKNIFYASLKWFQQHDAITEENIRCIKEMEKYRNVIVHELYAVICEGIKEKDVEKLFQLIDIYKKIDSWWIYNIEADWDEIENANEVKQEDCISGTMTIQQVILDIVLGNGQKYDGLLEQIKTAMKKKNEASIYYSH